MSLMKRKNLLYIGNALSHKGNTVSTIDTLGSLLKEEGYHVSISSRLHNKALRLLDMLWSVITHRNKIDTVLIDTYSTSNYWYAVYVAKLCRFLRIPYVPILHGGNLPYRIKNSQKSAQKLFTHAKINIAPSRYLLKAFNEEGYSNSTHIPNSIEIDNYTFKVREKCKPTLLWVRSFAHIYNPIMAIEVLQELRKKYPEATLTMIGPQKDDSYDKCTAFAKANNLPVTFTGKLSKAEWIALSTSCDIFINTTDFDNTPVSLIEAMALGLPVISTNVGGIPYLIDDQIDGLLSPPRDVEAFTKKVISLLETPDLVTVISKNARTKVEKFDWALVKTLWIDVLS